MIGCYCRLVYNNRKSSLKLEIELELMIRLLPDPLLALLALCQLMDLDLCPLLT
jgi:hypothetical protein